jgi:ER-bound oxygenase mpaB/B'/Rubber oxygenase, catalytic domain
LHIQGATRVVETLTRTGGFATPVVRHRLYETTQHVLQVTMSPESLQPGGAGFISSVRVRLLHAAVRSRIRALAAADPGYFDISTWGLPISDLDAAATIGTFSATIVWLALPRQGIIPTAQEEADYMALWRYVGYLVGAPDAPLRSVASARRFMESLLMREIAPSDTGRALAANTLAGLSYAPPQRASPVFLHALTHWLNGHQLADALGVPRAPWYYTLLVAGQCWGFMLVCYSHRAIPALDRRKIKALRRVFWNVIVTGKTGLGEEAVFEFKYIPQLGKSTNKNSALKRTSEGGLWSKEGGVEWRSLLNLLVALLLPVGLYVAWWMTQRVGGL